MKFAYEVFQTNAYFSLAFGKSVKIGGGSFPRKLVLLFLTVTSRTNTLQHSFRGRGGGE